MSRLLLAIVCIAMLSGITQAAEPPTRFVAIADNGEVMGEAYQVEHDTIHVRIAFTDPEGKQHNTVFSTNRVVLSLPTASGFSILWADDSCQGLHRFVAASILETQLPLVPAISPQLRWVRSYRLEGSQWPLREDLVFITTTVIPDQQVFLIDSSGNCVSHAEPVQDVLAITTLQEDFSVYYRPFYRIQEE